MSQQKLFEYLDKTIGFGTKEIAESFRKIDRLDFVPEDFCNQAYSDYPLPIGFNATISQPTTVAFMINKLLPNTGDKILDVGSGSGWTTALLARIVGESGKVFGVEIVPQLVEFGKNNLGKYKFSNAEIFPVEKKGLGLPKFAPFDKILVSAAANEIPQSLIDQLKIGGRMIIPVLNSIWQIDKLSETKIKQIEFPGFVFVPLK